MKLITNKLATLLLSLGFALGAFLLPSTTASAQRVALKNNLAYDALLTPNLSFEVALGKKWTLDLQGGANFFLYEKDATSSKYKASPKWSHWLLEPEVRYRTCEKFYGFFVGAHALGGLANVAGVNIPFVLQNKDGVMKDHRYEAWYAGGGLSVGYQWILSDRGVQYTSKAYVQKLHTQGCRISMTQTGDPLHNAMAERINNTIKNSWFVSCKHQTFQEAQEAVDRAIVMYNEARPHQAIGNRTPMQMIMSEATNPLVTDELTHIKPSPKLLKIARQRAKKEPRK